MCNNTMPTKESGTNYTINPEIKFSAKEIKDREATLCAVVMDGRQVESTDFVAVLSRSNGDASILYNTDALTLGMAMKMVTAAFVRCMNECTDEERAQVTEILSDVMVQEKEAVTDTEETHE